MNTCTLSQAHVNYMCITLHAFFMPLDFSICVVFSHCIYMFVQGCGSNGIQLCTQKR